MTTEEFKEALDKLFRIKVSKDTKTTIEFEIRSKKVKILKSYFTSVVDKLNGFEIHNETEVFDKNTYEVAIGSDFGRPTLFFAMRDTDSITKTDAANGIKYILSKPSDEYLIYILKYLLSSEAENGVRGPGLMSYRIERLFDKNKAPKLLDIVKELIPRFYTLKIQSTNSIKRQDFENLSFGFLFNFSYNLDSPLSPLRFLEEVSRSLRIRRIRRSSIEEIEPPKRTYINDLILHYQKGISSESIDHQYLSFYHITEHFFEKIYNEEIIKEVKTKLTLPSFSHKKDKDIKELIATIQKKLRYKNEEFQINEPEALKLTLAKFIDIDELKNEIEKFDKSLIDYYKQNEVVFCLGNKVDFDSGDLESIFKNLSQRIYKTRNAIVHSKETEKSRFIPFRDDKYLIKEIHLMRVIGEKIIICSSIINE